MANFFSRFFKPAKKNVSAASEESFASRYHRFRLFMSAYLEAYGEMMSFEERLGAELPFGMPFLRICTARMTVSAMQCVMQLSALCGGKFSRMDAPFSRLREEIKTVLDKGAPPLSGPFIIPYNAVDEGHAAIVSPNLVKLSAIRKEHPEFMPRGFIVTGAAWWRYFDNQDMHEEIDRLMVISQEDSGSYAEASVKIREVMTTSFPLPDDVERALTETLAAYPELDMPGWALLIRCLPVLPEHGALVLPEQLLHTPVDAKSLLDAFRTSFAMAYRPRSILYRLKKGVRDRGMPLCLSVTLIPEVHGRGSAHRRLELAKTPNGEAPANANELFIHIRRGFSSPVYWTGAQYNAPQTNGTTGSPLPAQATPPTSRPVTHAALSDAGGTNISGDTAPEARGPDGADQVSDESASLPEAVLTRLNQSLLTALDYLKDSPVRGNRHELFWATSEQGRLYILGVNVLPDPGPSAACGVLPEIAEELPSKAERSAATICLEGGIATYPGYIEGPTYPVRNVRDALAFPLGGILAVPQASPRWSFLLSFASGAVAGDGTGHGMFARTARRYGVPTVLKQPDAFAAIRPGIPTRIHACSNRTPRVCVLSEASREAVRLPLWQPDSPLASMARELAPKIVPLTLPDSDHVDFRAENCNTLHDILNYCQVQAVKEMFRSGTMRKSADAPAKQLVCEVPKQFWIINMEDGFTTAVSGPVVQLSEIASIPMLALWEGFTYKPWEGPPQLNAKGFLSVLFEASANPNLDPASQSTQYTEKNVFLIAKRFCSMRCRFGFHYLSMDCLIGERPQERFIMFQFKGGAANLARRIRRVHFVAELLAQFDFATEIISDILTARMESGSEADFVSAIKIIGYITMHTRQLDMIMGDEQELARHRERMLEDMRQLAKTP